jgi:putative endonuclease
MRLTTTQRGAAAETLAARYLETQGLTVVARNLRCRAGELDLVCLDRATLVIVEVRQRSRSDFGGAPASVTPGKRRRLLRAAAFHWQRRPAWRKRMLRFDVIALEGPGEAPALTWIRDAFRADRGAT